MTDHGSALSRHASSTGAQKTGGGSALGSFSHSPGSTNSFYPQLYTSGGPTSPIANIFSTAPGGLGSRAKSGGDQHTAGAMEYASYEALWSDICRRVMPLFNGEGVLGPIEDANDLVRRIVQGTSIPFVMDRLAELANAGMDVLIAKLAGVGDEKLVYRVVEVWAFLFGTVLPYFQGVFLPFRTELRVSNSVPVTTTVRGVLLTSFRDRVILPLIGRLREAFQRLVKQDSDEDRGTPDAIPRLSQMLIMLSEIRDENHAQIDSTLRRFKDDLRASGRTVYAA